jgi:hypothetical protein
MVCADGCGSTTCNVSGEATYDGRPIENGMITLLPADGKGQPVSAPITAGRYSVAGVSPGQKIVQISTGRQTGSPLSSEELQRLSAEAKAKGHSEATAEPAGFIPPSALGNNARVEVREAVQTLNFSLQNPVPRKIQSPQR